MGLAGPVHAMAVSSAISQSKWNWDHPCLWQPCTPITYTLPYEDGSEHFPTWTVTSMPAPFEGDLPVWGWQEAGDNMSGCRSFHLVSRGPGREGGKGRLWGKEMNAHTWCGQVLIEWNETNVVTLHAVEPTPTPATSWLHLSFPPKQPHLAVIYCTNGGFTAWPAPLDRRAVSFQASLAFSASEGIVSEVVHELYIYTLNGIVGLF